MLESFFTIALRNFSKHRLYSIINVLGFAVGLASCTLLALIIRHEVSYDAQHQKVGRTYRVIEFLEKAGVGEESASLPFPFAPRALEDFPKHIEHAVRIFNFQVPNHTVAYEGIRHSEARFYFADTSFFGVFDYPLAQGDPQTALSEKKSVLLSYDKAQEYFGDREPIGRELIYEGRDTLTVTGVFAKEQKPSHFSFDFIASFDAIQSAISGQTLKRNWIWNPCWTYIVLEEGKSPEDLEYLFEGFVDRHFSDLIKDHVHLYLQPLQEIHLHSNLDYELAPNGDVQYIYIFTVMANLLLVVTAINFINLSTARSSVRAMEVGVRKALGAYRWELLAQFLVEFFIVSLVAMLVAMVMVELSLPYLSKLVVSDFDFTEVPLYIPLGIVGGGSLTVGLLSSIYPAYYLSKFSPAPALKGQNLQGVRGRGLRSVLVVIQFMITIFLTVTTLVAFKQHRHLSHYELGFQKEGIMVLPVANTNISADFHNFRKKLIDNPSIREVTAMDEVLGRNYQTHQFKLSKDGSWVFFPSLIVRQHFIDLFEMEMAAGSAFSKDGKGGETSIIINESMVSHLGWSTPSEALGETIIVPEVGGGIPKTIVGVVKDFHFAALHEEISPFILSMASGRFAKIWSTRFVVVKLAPSADEELALAQTEQVWKEYLPNKNFQYFWLSEELDKHYAKELKMGVVSGSFALVAVLLACLGLFGLSSFVVEQRRREIAIRKALGISDGEVVLLLWKEFVMLVGVASLIAWPLSYLMMRSWLSTFPYPAPMDGFIFLFSAFLILGVTLVTISYHTIRMARRNLVEAL